MIADQIRQILSEAGLPAYTGDLPGNPDNVVAVLEYDSNVSTEYFGTQDSASILNPYVKVIIRSTKYKDGEEWADQVKKTLHKYHDDTLMSVFMVGSPMYLGRSAAKLHEFQVTFQIQVKE
jgi:hypothetical protein